MLKWWKNIQCIPLEKRPPKSSVSRSVDIEKVKFSALQTVPHVILIRDLIDS